MADILNLLDDEGENRALRSFLMQYSCDRAVSVEWMCQHMEMCGWGREFVPEFARSHHGQNLTKAGAQIWIRHLLDMERRASPAAAVPDGALPPLPKSHLKAGDYDSYADVYAPHEVQHIVRAAVEADRAQQGEPVGYAMMRNGKVEGVERTKACTEFWVNAEAVPLTFATKAPAPATGIPTCTYPKCSCPFDAPSDPNWCARGLAKAGQE